MRKRITLFSCLFFTPLSAQTLPITSGFFYLFFIAFIVIFFILGIIIGYVLNPRREPGNEKERPLVESSKETMEEPKDLGQDGPTTESNPLQGPDNRDVSSGNYTNYWGYYNHLRR